MSGGRDFVKANAKPVDRCRCGGPVAGGHALASVATVGSASAIGLMSLRSRGGVRDHALVSVATICGGRALSGWYASTLWQAWLRVG